jgi:hypothetical protein
MKIKEEMNTGCKFAIAHEIYEYWFPINDDFTESFTDVLVILL